MMGGELSRILEHNARGRAMSPTPQRQPISNLAKAALSEVQRQRDTIAELVAMLRDVIEAADSQDRLPSYAIRLGNAYAKARALLDRHDPPAKEAT